MRFKDFEIRPTCFLDGHKDQKKWDVSKTDEHGFPAIKIIIPPENWNITKEA